ncbi:MAG: alcohol dehydrogenase catalytic domain-containing protein [Thermomicrobiales bacterium]|nr:alcohol dehydrogenase catalytic domain-containing protein [Thermomicrobiales bacterium]
MKAIVVDAEWAPRPRAVISPEDEARRWAVNANDVYKNPTVSLEDRPDPAGPGPKEVVLEVGACGICGSDVHMFETDDEGYMLLPYHMACPVVTGHEFAGKVVAVGSEVTEFVEGDLVAAEEIQWCGVCNPCRGGYWNQCKFVEDLGFTIDGGFAEYATVNVKHCWSLNGLLDRYGDEETALEVGAMTEPTSVVYEGMFTRAGGFQPGRDVAVFGGGPIGLAAVALAKAAGAAHVFCFEPLDGRRSLAEKLGATHVLNPLEENPTDLVEEVSKGEGVAMAVECTGNFGAVMTPMEDVLGVGGKIAVVGMDARPAQLQFITHQLKGSSVYGTLGHCGTWDFPNVIALMASGQIEMEHAITKRHPLAEMVDAVEETKNRADGKVLVKSGM